MNSYEILTDSTCDFSPKKYTELGLHCVPLTVSFRGETYPDRNDDSLRDMYAGLRAGEAATTAAINPQGWSDSMRPLLDTGRDLLVLVFSSGLSTTFQSAKIAAEELAADYPARKIRVVDSLCASLGEGLLAWYAVKKREEGLTLDELGDWLENNRLHLCHWFTVDDLMYLKRGGRISSVTALVGTMLGVKPVLHVDDEGHLINVGKARGRKASIQALADKVAELAKDYDNPVMFISHGDCIEDARYLEGLLKDRYGITEIYTNYIGAVIGSHSGPGTLALFFMGEHR